MLFPKNARYKNPAYLDYVSGHACCSCLQAGPSDAHHFMENLGGMARKVDDLFTVPLCRKCHTHWHDQRWLPSCAPKGKTAADFTLAKTESIALMYQHQALLMARWVKLHSAGSDHLFNPDDLF